VVVEENYLKLVFFLRTGVRWHDGKQFSSKDVKYTFDLVRETPEARDGRRGRRDHGAS